MGCFGDEYRSKLTTAEDAVKVVKSGNHVFYGEFVLFPQLLDSALADRIHELENVEIRSTCYTKSPKVVEKDPEGIHAIVNDYHFSGTSRKLHDNNQCNYIPITYHQVPRIIRKYLTPDVAFITTAPMDKNGYFNFGLANSITGANLSKAKHIVVEVNENVPYCLGGNFESIHISSVAHIVEGSNPPLAEVKSADPSEVDKEIANYIMNEIEDGACLQMGIGSMPNLVGAKIAQSDLKDLGIHTEMLVDSCIDLYDAGRVTGNRKSIDRGKMVYSFALGTDMLYKFMDNNPLCASYPVSYTNDPRIIALNDKVIAVNNALEVDLLSQVSSESSGFRHISGTGGQLDFIMGAFASHGGKGFICLSSTYSDKNGQLRSRIVPSMQVGSVVTVPRSMVQYVVTEYGIVQLKGKSTWKRAEALISIAHPTFQDELVKAAQGMKIWVKTNQIEP